VDDRTCANNSNVITQSTSTDLDFNYGTEILRDMQSQLIELNRLSMADTFSMLCSKAIFEILILLLLNTSRRLNYTRYLAILFAL
jgi:hypothetical protein